jgi:hypothetical protein
MASQIRQKAQVQKAEDLPILLPQQSKWDSQKECERSIFRSLDISMVLHSKQPLLNAMDVAVKTILDDAFSKGILIRRNDGLIAFAA